MKKSYLFMTGVLSLGLVSCSSDLNSGATEATTPSNVVASKMEMALTTMNVNVPTGKVAIVTQGADTLAVCSSTQEIVVPTSAVQAAQSKALKAATTSSEEENASTVSPITVSYINENEMNNSIKKLNKQNAVFEIVTFEDTEKGDYDYNDLIVHAKLTFTRDNKTKEGTLKVEIHPIALGSTKPLQLGISYGTTGDGNTQESILFKNCRVDLFGDNSGVQNFINTSSGQKPTKYAVLDKVWTYTIPNAQHTFFVDWFIVTPDNKKLCAISNNYKFTNTDYRPFGFVLSGINKVGYMYQKVSGEWIDCGYDWWNYPAEASNIETVFPGIQDIFSGKSNDYSIFSTPKSTSRYVDAIEATDQVVNGKACRVATDECIYNIVFPSSQK